MCKIDFVLFDYDVSHTHVLHSFPTRRSSDLGLKKVTASRYASDVTATVIRAYLMNRIVKNFSMPGTSAPAWPACGVRSAQRSPLVSSLHLSGAGSRGSRRSRAIARR